MAAEERMKAESAGLEAVAAVDPEVAEAIRREEDRQRGNLELIASENYVSRAVLAAAGSVLTNKYAEGYPGKRYYGGCECVDIAESLAIERAKQLFGAEHANVQPHSGTQANMAVYFSVCRPGDTIMGMDLNAGGHLTHGAPLNFSGQFYNVVSYGVDRESHLIDYDELARLAEQHRPRLIVAGASAYPRLIDFARFRQVADSVGALLMVDMAHIAGLVAGGVHPSPVPHAHFVTTTTHKTLRGPRAGLVLCKEEFAAQIDKMVLPGIQGGPLMHILAAKAVCLKEALEPSFREYAAQIVKNAKALAQGLMDAGHKLISGGTDNHLMLLDLTPTGLTGRDAQKVLDRAGITTNKNGIPFDTRKPWYSSGIRLGTPALTTRGMKEPEMARVAELITRALERHEDKAALSDIKKEVRAFCRRFPLNAWQ